MNRKHRTPALLLCLCTLLTAGCSRGGGEAAQEENVSYSQTLYPGMEMSAEQKETGLDRMIRLGLDTLL